MEVSGWITVVLTTIAGLACGYGIFQWGYNQGYRAGARNERSRYLGILDE